MQVWFTAVQKGSLDFNWCLKQHCTLPLLRALGHALALPGSRLAAPVPAARLARTRVTGIFLLQADKAGRWEGAAKSRPGAAAGHRRK